MVDNNRVTGSPRPSEPLRRTGPAVIPPPPGARPATPPVAPARDEAGVAGAQAVTALAPRGPAALPTGPQGADAVDSAGFDGFDAPAPAEVEGLPERFDAAARDRFIGAELDRLGLEGSARASKQGRMLVLFRAADANGDGVVAGAERHALVRGLIAGAQADAISTQLQTRAAQQARAIQAAGTEAKAGNLLSRGFNSLVNVFNSNMDQMDEARNHAVKQLNTELPRDLERYNDMVAEAGGDPGKLQSAQDYLQGALVKSQAAGEAFDKRRGEFSSGNKFWSGLAADVGAGLLVLGGTAIALTGFGAPIGAGLIAAGFAAGGAASVGLHAALDNQYSFKDEALGNFLVGGISAAATVATAGLSAGVTSGLAGTVGKYASSHAITAGLTTFAQESATGFQGGWMTRLAVGTATGAVLGRASGVAGSWVGKVIPGAVDGVESALMRRIGSAASGAAAGALGSGGGAVVNEAVDFVRTGEFREGALDRFVQQTLGGVVAGAVQSQGPNLEKAFETHRTRTFEARQSAERTRLADVDARAALGDPDLARATQELTGSQGYQDRVAEARAAFDDALGQSPDGGPGFYTQRAERDLLQGVDSKLARHIDEVGEIVGREVPKDARRARGKVLEGADVAHFEETAERLLARNPEALKRAYAAAYEAVGINPKAVEKLVHDYTHSSNSHNPDTFHAISEAAQHIANGGAPRQPTLGPDGKPVRLSNKQSGGEFEASYKYDAIIKQMMETRSVRANFLQETTGLPVGDAYRVYRGTGSAGTVKRIAEAWFNNDPTININNYGITSSSLDARTGVDFGLNGPRSKTVQADKTVAPYDPKKATYVAYDFDVETRHVLFDKYTDGGYSTDGLLQQRIQREVLIASPEATISTDARRAVVTFEGQTYTYNDREALRAAMAARPDWDKKPAKAAK